MRLIDADALEKRFEYLETFGNELVHKVTEEEKGIRMAYHLAKYETHVAPTIVDTGSLRPQWIPVAERLPKKQAWYHVAIRDKKTMRVSVEQDLYSVETAKNFGHEIGFCKANRWPEREELIAGMPLPEAPEE